jgi:hypothetical protein
VATSLPDQSATTQDPTQDHLFCDHHLALEFQRAFA